MLELPHVLVGSAIASLVPPPFSFPLALASHFAIDLLPHWNPHISTELKRLGRVSPASIFTIAVDSSLALVIGLLLSASASPDITRQSNIFICSFLSVLPDLLEYPHFFLKNHTSWVESLVAFQRRHQGRAGFLSGLFTQALIIIVSLAVIYLSRLRG